VCFSPCIAVPIASLAAGTEDVSGEETSFCYFYFPFIISFILWVEGGVIPETRK
jgi:hypothetical protein